MSYTANSEDIRIRAAGLYIKDNQILLVKHKKKEKEYFLLPGGGQNKGESLRQALKREWKEELNLNITLGNFLFMGESIPPKNEKKFQVLQIVFEIIKAEGNMQVMPDGILFDAQWVSLDDFSNYMFFPACIKQIKDFSNGIKPEKYEKYPWI
ncbi:MAG: NUDIX domain-containing protein [Spirochaetia bacterium]|nr:NUDIX domain-containing protein [Spirochaetia bacterium]